MTPQLAIDLVRAALVTAVLLAAPLLAAATLAGLIVGVLQTATGVQEQTPALVIKLVAVGATGLVLLPWSIGVATRFAGGLLGGLAELVR